MAAIASLKFSQGASFGNPGYAFKGTTGTTVTVENSNNTDVASWQIDLVYVDPLSSILPTTPFAFDDNGSTPIATFIPDVRGSYRFVLKVWNVANRTGSPSDTDIRLFSVPEPSGLVVPPPQLWPRALPVPQSGEVGNKPNEFNFGGQTDGWAGNGSNDGLLNDLIRRVDQFSGSTAIQETVTVTFNGQTSFTLSQPTTSNTTAEMYLNGVKLTYGTEYTVNSNAVTYLGSVVIRTTDVVDFWYIVGPLNGTNSARQEVLPVTVNGQTAFTLSQFTTSSDTVEMYVNRSKLVYGVDYQITGNSQVTYVRPTPLQTTDIVEFWYLVGPVVSVPAVERLIPDPDTAKYGQTLKALGVYDGASVKNFFGRTWVVNRGNQSTIPAGLVEVSAATMRPIKVIESPVMAEVWKDVVLITSSRAVVVGDSGTARFIRDIDLTTSPPTQTLYSLGASTATGTSLDTNLYNREAQIVHQTGTLVWVVTAAGAVRINMTSPGGPYTTVGPSTSATPRAIAYDSVGANYSDLNPRMWLVSDTGSTAYLDRIELAGPTVDNTYVQSSVSFATQVFVGGGFTWFLYKDTGVNYVLRKVNPNSVASVGSLSLTSPTFRNGAYDPVSSRVVLVGYSASLQLVIVNPATPSVVSTLVTTYDGSSSGYSIPTAFLNEVWVPFDASGDHGILRLNVTAQTYAPIHSRALLYT